jgi:hypothetical protein
MVRHCLLVATAALALAACGRGAERGDAPAGNTATVVYATTECTVVNADGERCDRKTCKEDARSDCASFSDRCTRYGHTYEGSDSAGTCVREDQIT